MDGNSLANGPMKWRKVEYTLACHAMLEMIRYQRSWIRWKVRFGEEWQMEENDEGDEVTRRRYRR